MKLVSNFISELISFSKSNWWIYIVYFFMLVIIYDKQSSALFSVNLVVSIHFIGDIFIMMMLSAYAAKQYSSGAYFQLTSMFLFLAIKIFTGLSGGGWHYLLADPIYILAAIKNYYLDVKRKDITTINAFTMTFLSVAIITGFMMSASNAASDLANSFSKGLQTAGIFMFAIALSVTGNERRRYLWSLLAQAIMVVGSAFETYNTWSAGHVVGLAISYMLLPLTVLIFYLNRWKSIMNQRPVAIESATQSNAGKVRIAKRRSLHEKKVDPDKENAKSL